jgi:hypothetical protein
MIFSLGSHQRRRDITGFNEQKELFAIMVILFPKELRDTYLSTVQE